MEVVLGRFARLVGALRAAKPELVRCYLIRRQVFGNDIAQSFHEDRIVVQGLCPFKICDADLDDDDETMSLESQRINSDHKTHLLPQMAIFEVELVKSLNVIRRKSNRHHQHVLDPPFAQPFQSSSGVGSQPGGGPDF